MLNKISLFAAMALLGGRVSVTAGEEFTTAFTESMMALLPEAVDDYDIEPIFTIGEGLPTFEGGVYFPPGILDGMGSWRVNIDTVRVYTNHELSNRKGYAYEACADPLCETTFELRGARVSFYDFDINTLKIKNAGVPYKFIYGANGELLTDLTKLRNRGLERFCSAQFVDAHEYGFQRGIEDKIYFAPEETGGQFDPLGGAYWALDVFREDFWQVPMLARGAWESLTQVDTGTTEFVAFVLSDDTDPIDIDGDGQLEYAPLFMYVGKKNRLTDDFLSRNGLRDGKLYVWVPANSEVDSEETFSGTGNVLAGSWVEIDNTPQPQNASFDGSTGFDFDGYPTQFNLWIQARDVGAFRFSRPEDITTFSKNPDEFVLVTTGVPQIAGFDQPDRFGTIYSMKVSFSSNGDPLFSVLRILNDADDDLERNMRSPDNIDAADNGLLYINEDRAVKPGEDDGELPYGPTAVNPNEAQLVRLDPKGPEGNVFKIAQIDRNVLLDPTGPNPVDVDAGDVGAWESSGVLDVSVNFGREPGTLLVFNVQAHGLEDQVDGSRLNDDDLVEGGQLLFLHFKGSVSGAAIPKVGAMAAFAVLAVAAALF